VAGVVAPLSLFLMILPLVKFLGLSSLLVWFAFWCSLLSDATQPLDMSYPNPLLRNVGGLVIACSIMQWWRKQYEIGGAEGLA